MDIKHRMIVLDAADLDAESTFWAGFLDGTVEKWNDRWHAIWVDGDWALGVQHSPEHQPPTWPDPTRLQQIHLDLYFEGQAAHAEAHNKALTLGARVLKSGDPTATRGTNVYADPAGHPFCLCWVPPSPIT